MYSFTIKDVSLHTIIDRRRIKNSGLYPVKVSIQCHRKQLYIPVGMDIEEWPEEGSNEALRLKAIFDSVCETTQETVLGAQAQSLPQTQLMQIKEALKRPSKLSPSLDAYLEAKMQQCLNEGRMNSFYRVRTTLRALQKFAPESKLSDVTPDFLQRFERHLFRHGLTCTSVHIYMKTLKSALHDAVDAGAFDQSAFPFGIRRYEPPQPSQRKTALTREQISAIISFKGEASLEQYRDLWLFSYLCNGINFKDMLFLRYSNIHDSEIIFTRAKTRHSLADSRKIHAYITPEMLSIIQRRGNPHRSSRDSFIFPYAREGMTPLEASNMVRRVISLTNKALKRISAILDIPPFTTYSARHSFATILKRQGIDLSYISECLGHSSLATTEIYLAGFDTEDRRKYSSFLTTFD